MVFLVNIVVSAFSVIVKVNNFSMNMVAACVVSTLICAVNV